MRWLPRLAMATVLLGGAAHAQETAVCEVPIVQAMHNGDDGREPTIDPKIDRLRPYLMKAPFIAWRDFKLIDRKDLEIPLHGSRPFTLPNGREAALTFQEHSAGPGDHRLTLRLTIDDPKKKSRMIDTTFVLDEGGVVLHVGQHYQGGILILGVSCKTH